MSGMRTVRRIFNGKRSKRKEIGEWDGVSRKKGQKEVLKSPSSQQHALRYGPYSTLELREVAFVYTLG